jgi:hypothetical protein
MIQPTYVDFNTAKLLKEKGFDVNVESCSYGHSKNENWIYKVHPEFPGWKGRIREAYFENEEPLLKAEQWQVVEWFRLKFNIFIEVRHLPFNQKFGYRITGKYNEQNKGVLHPYNFTHFNSPQEAYSSAIDYVLNNLI